MSLTIGSLVFASFLVSIVALAILIWAISRSQVTFDQKDANTVFDAEAHRARDMDDPSVDPERATSPLTPSGREATPRGTRILLLAIFSVATLFLLAGSGFGLIASLKLHLPDWLSQSAMLTFGRMRAMHLNAVAFGWLSLGGIGLALWLVPTIMGTHLRLAWLAGIGAALWAAGTAAGVHAIGTGWTDGLEWLEIPWQIDILLAAGGACVAVALLATAAKREVHHIYVTGWYYIGALVWFPVLFFVANIPGLHVGAQQATVNWWFAHNVLGLWLTPIGVGAAYYFIPRIIGKPIYSYRLSLIGFWALALFYSQVGIHHLIGGPVPTWVVTLSVVQSVMMFVPVIAVGINQHTLTFGNLDVFRASIPLRFISVGALLYTLASFQGSLEAVRAVNTITHFTHYTVGHAHLGAYGFVTLVMFGAFYYTIPRLTGRVWPSVALMRAHFWLVILGFAIYFVSLTVGGWLQGLAMLDASRDFLESMQLTVPYLTARSVGGGLMTLGHLLFAVNLALMLAGLGRKREARPAGAALQPGA